MPSIFERFQHGWNAFLGRDPTSLSVAEYGAGSSYRPDRARYYGGADRSIISSVIARISIDVSQVDIRHVRIDENDRYVDTIRSKLNNALTLEANIDQTGRNFVQDIVTSMCDEGVVAIIPTVTSSNIETGTFNVIEMRTGRVKTWYPKHVKVEVYNDDTGKREELVLPKRSIAIVQNPLYDVMNEPNSTLQRLKRILANMDVLNEQNASGKLDLIIQLPYVVKTTTRREQAEKRRKEIEMQLTGSKYGIAYTDGTERITQLNRPVENNLWTQAKELTSMLYNQLGLTQSVFDGTADEKTMTNYYNRTIEPILSAITEEMERKFLTPTARTQGQAIKYFRDPFKLVTVETIANFADSLTRNEIATKNEIRTLIGWKPSDDPRADELRNSNINQSNAEISAYDNLSGEADETGDQISNADMSPEEVDKMIELLSNELEELIAIKESQGEEAEGDGSEEDEEDEEESGVNQNGS